ITNGLLSDWRFVAQPPQDLCRGEHILFAVNADTLQIVFFVVHPVYISAADIVFGRGNAQGCRHEVKGDVTPEIAESPKFHRVQMVDFPGLFAPYIQLGREWKSVDDHPSA